MNEDYSTCEYYDCLKPATIVIALRGDEYPVCDQHADDVTDNTGYCPITCQLGYGCDGSC